MEERSRQNLKKLLMYFGVGAGVVVLSLVTPQLPYILLKSYLNGKKFNKNKFNRSLKNLQHHNFIRYRKEGDSIKINLTKQGQIAINNYKFYLMEIKKQEKWDKKWRMVIFDIPHKKKNTRDALRRKLNQLGFLQFQKSVFICPYECEKEIRVVTDLFEVSEYVKFMVIEKIDDEHLLKGEFDLS